MPAYLPAQLLRTSNTCASIAGAFFNQRTWGPKQSFLLGAVLTDGHLPSNLSGFVYTAHCGDVGYIAILCALLNGFAPGRYASWHCCNCAAA